MERRRRRREGGKGGGRGEKRDAREMRQENWLIDRPKQLADRHETDRQTDIYTDIQCSVLKADSLTVVPLARTLAIRLTPQMRETR